MIIGSMTIYRSQLDSTPLPHPPYLSIFQDSTVHAPHTHHYLAATHPPRSTPPHPDPLPYNLDRSPTTQPDPLQPNPAPPQPNPPDSHSPPPPPNTHSPPGPPNNPTRLTALHQTPSSPLVLAARPSLCHARPQAVGGASAETRPRRGKQGRDKRERTGRW